MSPGRHVNYPTNTEPGCPTRLLNTGQQRGSGGHSSRKPRPNEVLSTKRWIFDPQRWAARMIYSRSKCLPQKASWKLQQLHGELRSQRSTPLMLPSLTFTWTICDARETRIPGRCISRKATTEQNWEGSKCPSPMYLSKLSF